MNENLNLVEILKDCPSGTKLYSTIYGDVELVTVYRMEDAVYPIRIRLCDNFTEDLTKDGRISVEYGGECTLFPSREERNWSKFKSKKPRFDPKTLQPFDKVLVKNPGVEQWKCGVYSHKNNEKTYRYITTDNSYICCIPYNDDTKHLVGTTEEAPEFYRYWEII